MTNKNEQTEPSDKDKLGWLPEGIRNGIGHFNVFKLDNFIGKGFKVLPYQRRDYHKIILSVGNTETHYADKIVEIQQQGLAFANPQIPYNCDNRDNIRSGFFCLFNKHFFEQYGGLKEYAVFQPGNAHIFELDDEQFIKVQQLFTRMVEEISSEYVHKYDILRGLVLDLIHVPAKLKPTEAKTVHKFNTDERIAALFNELLERQFPIDESHPQMQLKTVSDFARQLNIPVTHLNKAVKEITDKTTSEIIAERIARES